MNPMSIHRLIAATLCTCALAACKDVSQVSRAPNQTADARTIASLNARSDASAKLPDEVPVPPASASPIVVASSPPTSAETPVGFTKPDAAADAEHAVTNDEASADRDAASKPPSSDANPPAPSSGTDSAATNPLGTLDGDEQSKSMPMAAHGNNHSSPSLDPRAIADEASK